MLATENRFEKRYTRMTDEQLLNEFGIMPHLTLEAAIALRVELGKRGLGEDSSQNYHIHTDMTPPETRVVRAIFPLYKALQLTLLILIVIALVRGILIKGLL